MATIRCPHCGNPVMIRGSQWECGYCGDFGSISSLHPSEKAKLMQAATPSLQLTITVTDTSDDEEETPRRFSRSELEDMVRQWDLSEHDPETAIQMMKLLLDTAESHLQDPEVAEFLLGNELYDLCLSGYIRPRLLKHLKSDDRLARQLFQSAYVDSPQEDILLSCAQLGEEDLRQKLLDLLAGNPFPHDELR